MHSLEQAALAEKALPPPLHYQGMRLCAESGLTYWQNMPKDRPVGQLIILFHGIEHNGRMMLSQTAATLRALYPDAAIIAPNAPYPSATGHHFMADRLATRSHHHPTRNSSFQWFGIPQVDRIDRVISKVRAELNGSIDMVSSFMDARQKELGLSDAQTNLVGFSQGGCMASLVGFFRSPALKSVYNFCGFIIDPKYLARPITNKPHIFYGHVEGDEIKPQSLHHLTVHTIKNHQLQGLIYTIPAARISIKQNPRTGKKEFIRHPALYEETRERVWRAPIFQGVDNFGHALPIHKPTIVVDDFGYVLPAPSRIKRGMTAHFVTPDMERAAYAFSQHLCHSSLGTDPAGVTLRPPASAILSPAPKPPNPAKARLSDPIAMIYPPAPTRWQRSVRDIFTPIARLGSLITHAEEALLLGNLLLSEAIRVARLHHTPDSRLNICLHIVGRGFDSLRHAFHQLTHPQLVRPLPAKPAKKAAHKKTSP